MTLGDGISFIYVLNILFFNASLNTNTKYLIMLYLFF